ncbi:hypothetical protein WA026_022296 [Henosepilachna vigintioctopunctata]|uniref:Phorbol-ester/DAG-type domain-containing protein n=1 Tax=Henosepilachna vigintioctopunctata TaxID=420089 RepID=A0AAW1VBT3_9CUCU
MITYIPRGQKNIYRFLMLNRDNSHPYYYSLDWNKKVNACNDPLLETSKCGYCRNSNVKNGLKCSVCPKVFHPSCTMKLKKCCDVEITEILITDKVSEETTIMEPKIIDITSESPRYDLLMKIIAELQDKNAVLVENASLLKYKISILDTEMKSKGILILEFNKN